MFAQVIALSLINEKSNHIIIEAPESLDFGLEPVVIKNPQQRHYHKFTKPYGHNR
jgi:hypothetical protein